ncbi:YgiW/YdeI family stress tolerance OB fold protein [Enterobacteriaceae bacterium 4M9]|nr:YgiW/YdeI family stress tolerance OB fold protein [Enterobacteriaceae bacterium 4M9]
MKKHILALLLTTAAITAAPALAQNGGFEGPASSTSSQQRGGFNGPDVATTTVEQAKSMRDDSWVVLEGNIVRKVGDELYEFRDRSGTINVEIDDKSWNGLTVNPQDKVRLEGEVDKDWNSVELDVKRITKP